MARRLAIFVATLLAFVIRPGLAHAHAVGLSRGVYTISHETGGADAPTRVDASLVFARGDLLRVVSTADANRDGALSADELTASRATIGATLTARVVVRADGAVCPETFDDVALTDEDGTTVHVHAQCPASARTLTIALPILDDLAAGHRHLAHVDAHLVAAAGVDGSEDVVAFAGSAPIAIAVGPSDTAPPPRHVGAWSMLRLGIEHILTGYDHLVFLLGLVLIGGRLRGVLAVVTAFTVAHSITLALATLGVWSPSPRVVEPAIALSIAYVGVENFYAKNLEGRWRITFPFGLIHGFGFASALREIALPKAQIPLALLLFNVGVEIGQLAVLAPMLPLLAWLRGRSWFGARGVRAVSGGIFVIGVVLFVDRVVHPP
jgi:hydrogenase/urease accessory protein HupE